MRRILLIVEIRAILVLHPVLKELKEEDYAVEEHYKLIVC